MQPQYTHSIVNLVSSILKAGDAQPRYEALGSLPSQELENGCVLIVIDGLGNHYLQEHDTWMETEKRDDIQTVFPSETAVCLPTFNTGLAPGEHGITGWTMYAKELGSVIETMPMCLEREELYFSHEAVQAMYDHETVYEQVRFNSHFITTDELARSAYSEAHAERARIHGCETLESFFTTVQDVATDDTYVFAYWPELDGILHRDGFGEEAESLINDIDNHIQELQVTTPVIVTGDHGMTDVPKDIQLSNHKRLHDMLLLPLCTMTGKTAYCYVKPGRQAAFKSYVESELGHACTLYESDTLVDNQYFGLHGEHPRLDERVGEFTIVMDEKYAIYDNTEPFQATHGGLTKRELTVPLITF